MPKISVPIPDSIESVLRPVVLDVTRSLFQDTDAVNGVNILFTGDIQRAQQQGGAIGEPDKDPIKFPYSSQFSIEVNEEDVNDRVLVNNTFRAENPFLFRDDALYIGLRPVYAFKECTLTYKYRAKDKTEAVRWRDNIRNKNSQQREQFLYDVKYSYMIPAVEMVILKELHRLREANAGYGDTFESYFKNNSTSRFHYITNQSGSEGRWAVAESQMQVQGWFDFEGSPEQGSREEDAETWTISFTFKFQYEKPIEVAMNYPLMVHNQVLEQKFRPGPGEMPPYQTTKQMRTYSLSSKMLSAFESTNVGQRVNNSLGVNVPSFDEFYPKFILPNTKRVFTAMTNLVNTDLTDLMNLANIGGNVAVDPDILAILQVEYPYLTKPYESLFNISLYQDHDLMQDSWVTVDAQLNVKATADLNPRRQYHVRFGLIADPNKVPIECLQRLLCYPAGLLKYFQALDPNLWPLLPPPPEEGECYSLYAFQPVLTFLGRNNPSGRQHAPFTVQTAYAQSFKRPFSNVKIGQQRQIGFPHPILVDIPN